MSNFSRYNTDKVNITKKPTNVYLNIWKNFSYLSYLGLIQKCISQSSIKLNGLSTYSQLNKMNKFIDSIYFNPQWNYPSFLKSKIKDFQLGIKFEYEGDSKNSEKHFKLAQQKVVSILGENSILALLSKMAWVIQASSQLENKESITLYEELLIQFEMHKLENTLDVVQILDQLSLYQINAGNVEKSSDLIKKATRIRKRYIRSPSIELAKQQFTAYYCYFAQGLTEQAIDSLRLSFDNILQTKDKLNEGGIQLLVRTFLTLCSLYSNNNDIQKVELAIEQVEEYSKKQKLEHHIFLNTQIIVWKAELLKLKGDTKQCIALLEEGILLCNNNKYAKSLIYQNLSELYIISGDNDIKGLEFVNQAIKLEEEVSGKLSVNMPQYIYYKSAFLVKLGRVNEAIETLKYLKSLSTKIFSVDHPKYTEIMDLIATVEMYIYQSK